VERVTSRFSRQRDVFSKIVWKNRRQVPAAAVRVEDLSTVEDRLPRNSCRQVCCVFVARAASGHWIQSNRIVFYFSTLANRPSLLSITGYYNQWLRIT